MKIGIDLDGVVFDSERWYRYYSEMFEAMVIKRNSKTDNRIAKIEQRFTWTKEEQDEFFSRYNDMILSTANLMPGAREVLNLLKSEGHTLVVVTARGVINEKEIQVTKEMLEKYDLNIFDKIYFDKRIKSEVCLLENIDLFIDDNKDNCEEMRSHGIPVIYFKDAPSFNLDEDDKLTIKYNWGEIYNYIHSLTSSKIAN